MNDKIQHNVDIPYISFSEEESGTQIILQGQWTLRTLAESIKWRQEIKKLGSIKEKNGISARLYAWIVPPLFYSGRPGENNCRMICICAQSIVDYSSGGMGVRFLNHK